MTVAPEAVFIGGCPRSGTTLLASLLGALPGCVVTPESQFKQQPLHALQRDPSLEITGEALQHQLRAHRRFRQWGVALSPDDLSERLGPAELRQLLLTLARRVGEAQQLAAPLTTWIDHTPQNIESGLALTQTFPQARLIHIVRDPRAVAASLLPLHWGPQSAEDVAALWSHRLAHGLALEAMLPDRIRRVHYEQLCREPEQVISALADWLGLPLPEAALQPVSGFLPRYTLHQHGLIGSHPHPDRIDAWRLRLAPWQQRQIESRLLELMVSVGYAPDAPSPAPGERPPGPWRRWVQPSLRRLHGRIRHRLHQRRHGERHR